MVLFQISIWRITFYSIEKFKLEEKLAQFLIFSSSVFWVFPFLSARISSEELVDHFFLGTIGVLKVLEQMDQEDKEIKNLSLFLNSIIIGTLGLDSFSVRSSCFRLFDLVYSLFKKIPLEKFLFIAFGGIIAASLGILIDYWGYGEFVITPIKYFSRNIVEGEAAKHGVTPWWEYFYITQKLHPGFGLFIVICFLSVDKKYQRCFFIFHLNLLLMRRNSP